MPIPSTLDFPPPEQENAAGVLPAPRKRPRRPDPSHWTIDIIEGEGDRAEPFRSESYYGYRVALRALHAAIEASQRRIKKLMEATGDEDTQSLWLAYEYALGEVSKRQRGKRRAKPFEATLGNFQFWLYKVTKR